MCWTILHCWLWGISRNALTHTYDCEFNKKRSKLFFQQEGSFQKSKFLSNFKIRAFYKYQTASSHPGWCTAERQICFASSSGWPCECTKIVYSFYAIIHLHWPKIRDILLISLHSACLCPDLWKLSTKYLWSIEICNFLKHIWRVWNCLFVMATSKKLPGMHRIIVYRGGVH